VGVGVGLGVVGDGDGSSGTGCEPGRTVAVAVADNLHDNVDVKRA
jgi:hypothetical protein